MTHHSHPGRDLVIAMALARSRARRVHAGGDNAGDNAGAGAGAGHGHNSGIGASAASVAAAIALDERLSRVFGMDVVVVAGLSKRSPEELRDVEYRFDALLERQRVALDRRLSKAFGLDRAGPGGLRDRREVGVRFEALLEELDAHRNTSRPRPVRHGNSPRKRGRERTEAFTKCKACKLRKPLSSFVHGSAVCFECEDARSSFALGPLGQVEASGVPAQLRAAAVAGEEEEENEDAEEGEGAAATHSIWAAIMADGSSAKPPEDKTTDIPSARKATRKRARRGLLSNKPARVIEHVDAGTYPQSWAMHQAPGLGHKNATVVDFVAAGPRHGQRVRVKLGSATLHSMSPARTASPAPTFVSPGAKTGVSGANRAYYPKEYERMGSLWFARILPNVCGVEGDDPVPLPPVE